MVFEEKNTNNNNNKPLAIPNNIYIGKTNRPFNNTQTQKKNEREREREREITKDELTNKEKNINQIKLLLKEFFFLICYEICECGKKKAIQIQYFRGEK